MSDNYVKKKPFIWGKLTVAFHPKKVLRAIQEVSFYLAAVT